MNSILLQITSSYLKYILFVLAFWFLLKGHNKPGGGFIAGLLVSSAFILEMLAFGISKVRNGMFLRPLNMAVVGITIALFFAVLPIFFGYPFFQGLWLPDFTLPFLGTLHVGTPLFFDLGVFMAVIGFVVSVIVDLEKAE